MPFRKWLDNLFCQFCGETSVVPEPLCEVGILNAMLKRWVLFVGTQTHAAINAAALAIFIISQGIEQIWNCE